MNYLIKCLTFFLVILMFSCQESKANLGQGVIQIEPESYTELGFYESVGSECPIFVMMLSVHGFAFLEGISSLDSINFNPLAKSTKKNVILIRAMDTRDGWTELVVDEETQKTYWIKNKLRIESWDDLLLDRIGVTPKNGDQNPLRKSPYNGESLTKRFDDLCLETVEIIGDWLKVRNVPAPYKGSHCSIEPHVGFIQWRNDKELLVNFVL